MLLSTFFFKKHQKVLRAPALRQESGEAHEAACACSVHTPLWSTDGLYLDETPINPSPEAPFTSCSHPGKANRVCTHTHPVSSLQL